ncbi:MAG: hypothetical protein RLZZ628_1176 [Bacteroidota bacterium]|jgi:hypothetical protein
MRNFLKFSAFGCALLALTTACNKKEEVVIPVTPVDTEIVKHQLDRSLKNWNDHLSALITLKSYKELDDLSTEAKRTALIEELTAPTAVVASGDVLDVQSIRVNQLANLFANNPDAASLFKAEVSKQIHVGDKVMELTWQRGDNSYTTKCVTNKTGIAWDNVLYGVYMGDAAIESTATEHINTNSAAKKYEWNQSVNWIWGDKRGQMGYSMRITNTNGIVTSTVVDAGASMNSGTAFNKSVVVFDQGTQGTAKISLGLATPTAFLKFDDTASTVNGAGSKVLNTIKILYP